jgi:hypothetical protein
VYNAWLSLPALTRTPLTASVELQLNVWPAPEIPESVISWPVQFVATDAVADVYVLFSRAPVSILNESVQAGLRSVQVGLPEPGSVGPAANAGPAAGPTRASVVSAATASHPMRRKVVARRRARAGVAVSINAGPRACGWERRG